MNPADFHCPDKAGEPFLSVKIHAPDFLHNQGILVEPISNSSRNQRGANFAASKYYIILYMTKLFIHSFIHLFIHSFVHSFIHSSIHPFVRSPVTSLKHTYLFFVCLFFHSADQRSSNENQTVFDLGEDQSVQFDHGDALSEDKNFATNVADYSSDIKEFLDLCTGMENNSES